MKTITSLFLCSLVSIAFADPSSPPPSAIAKNELVSVNAYVTKGYKRVKQEDGRFKPETYAFGEGGRTAGAVKDDSIDALTFNQIARIIAEPLADQNYIPAKSPEDTKLLIMVYWGTTAAWGTGTNVVNSQNWAAGQSSVQQVKQQVARQRMTAREQQSAGPPMDPVTQAHAMGEVESGLIMIEMDNKLRDRQNDRTARIIGYQEDLASTDGLKAVAGLGPYRNELLSDIEDDRYFVILVACDFQTAMKEKKIKPLWWTRYNLRVRGNRFDEALGQMTRFASRYFGQNSKGLIRNRVPVGKVEIGSPTAVEVDAR